MTVPLSVQPAAARDTRNTSQNCWTSGKQIAQLKETVGTVWKSAQDASAANLPKPSYASATGGSVYQGNCRQGNANSNRHADEPLCSRGGELELQTMLVVSLSSQIPLKLNHLCGNDSLEWRDPWPKGSNGGLCFMQMKIYWKRYGLLYIFRLLGSYSHASSQVKPALKLVLSVGPLQQ